MVSRGPDSRGDGARKFLRDVKKTVFTKEVGNGMLILGGATLVAVTQLDFAYTYGNSNFLHVTHDLLSNLPPNRNDPNPAESALVTERLFDVLGAFGGGVSTSFGLWGAFHDNDR